jgi:peptide/nickel transport system substrate-binding protein
MRRIGSALAVASVVAAAGLGVSACGSSSSDSGGSAKSGGSISIGTVGPDSYDPALFQTTQAVQALHPVYTGLTTFKAAEGTAGGEIIPGLATSLPKITDGGKTYTFQLRKGLKYSDGTPVKAADFEHAVKRIVSLKGAYSSFFTGIVGASEYQSKGDKNADISGITSDEKTGKIVIKLKAPDAKFLFALSEPYVAPVPSNTPIKDLTADPPPGVGPYKIKVIDPSRKFVLTRNKYFNVPGLSKGHVDKITGVVTSSVPRMTQDVISGKLDFMTEDPTGDLLPQVRQKYPDRIREDTNPPNTYYFFLNVSLPPFNKLEARQAVNYAIDSRALVRVFGGRLQPGCTFLPPGLVGYKKYDCPYGDPNGPGNVAKAKQLVQKSGTKGQPITVYTNNKDPRPAIAQYYTDLLNSIGYKAKTKTLDQQVYFDRIGTKSTKAQTGFTDWFQDFPHPADFFQPLLSADSLQSTPTSNQGRVNDAKINKTTQDLTETPKKLADVAGQWSDLDQYAVKDKAYIAPYGYEKSTSFFSERMNFKKCAGVHAVWKNDWTQFCLK